MGEFPSGQRGQTVNLLRFASMVRIRPPPPNQNPVLTDWVFWFGMGIWMVRFEPIEMQLSGGQFLRPVQTLDDTIIFSCRARENANRIHHPQTARISSGFPAYTQKSHTNSMDAKHQHEGFKPPKPPCTATLLPWIQII